MATADQIKSHHANKKGILLGVYAIRSTAERAKELLGEANVHVMDDGTVYYSDPTDRHTKPSTVANATNAKGDRRRGRKATKRRK